MPSHRSDRRPSAPSTPVVHLAACLVVLPLLGGCASSISEADGPLDRERLARVLRHRGLDPHRVLLPYGVTEEMRAWVWETVPRKYEDTHRLKLLRDSLLGDRKLAIEYSWGYTGTAAEVFQYREANCLAFTNLFLGLAREIGIPVYFMEVENVETFRKSGDLVVVSDHIAVGHEEGPDRQIYDFSETPEDDLRFVHKVSDLRVSPCSTPTVGPRPFKPDRWSTPWPGSSWRWPSTRSCRARGSTWG